MTLFSDDAPSGSSDARGNDLTQRNDEPADSRGRLRDEEESFDRAPRSRRIGTALIVVAFALLLLMSLSPAPYVIEAPGPVFNTLGYNHPVGERPQGADENKPLIVVSGHETYPTKGALDLLTVSEIGDPNNLPSWGEVIQAWLTPSRNVIPLDVAFPPGQDLQQQNSANAQLMTDSQKDAVAAALNQLGYDFPQQVMVQQVVSGGPSEGALRVGDQVVAVNGVNVNGVQSLRDEIKKNGAGTPASIAVLRDGQKKVVTITPETTAGTVVIGIGTSMKYEFPFEVTIQLDNVGGPSAGQMFALGIMDTITPGYLNGGARIAGTGTIDNEGNIGAIGGIRQKMYGARAAGATVFLAPASNCDEVTGHIPAGLHVYAVKKLDDSIAVLDAVRDHKDTSHLAGCPAS